MLTGATLAMAALAIILAVALTATGPVQAENTTATTFAPGGEGNNPSPQQMGSNPSAPEPCPGDESRPDDKAAPVVDSGHYALFDVYWNPDEGELTNNPCPPEVEHVPGKPKKGSRPATPAVDNRSQSSINIDETIIHIPSSAMVDLRTSTEYTEEKYPKVWAADNAENPNGPGDRIVWVLEACPPNGTPPDGGLCISYSAALLDPAYWEGNIQYQVGHVHQVDTDKQDRRYVLVYDASDDRRVLRWDSSDGRVDTVPVAPGGYDRPKWFFTSRGAYEFQVHIEGYPDTTRNNPRSKDPSVTSDVREYILHVGAESDLGVTASVEPALEDGDTTLDPGDNVAIEITASNAGPDTAPMTKVDVVLPEGLTLSTLSPPQASAGTYDSTTNVWTIGELAVTNDDNPDTTDDSPTLTITAEVDAGTRGEELEVKATISAKETLTTTSGTYDVPVPDPDPSNNMATGTTTVASRDNVDPMFQVTRSVPENSPDGTTVGDPIGVKNPDGDPLTFGLAGVGAGNFTFFENPVAGSPQIVVAEGAHLNFEHKPSYDLVLTVSDGKNEAGDSDGAIDDKIAVNISLEDVDEHVSATVAVTRANGSIRWEFMVTNPPAGATKVFYRHTLTNTATERTTSGAWHPGSLAASFTRNDGYDYGPGTYRIAGAVQYDLDGTTHYIHANISGDETVTIPDPEG